jgi:hypothetical protein
MSRQVRLALFNGIGKDSTSKLNFGANLPRELLQNLPANETVQITINF